MIWDEFVVGGSAGREKAKVCLFQAGPEAQPQATAVKNSMSIKRLIVSAAASPFAKADEATC